MIKMIVMDMDGTLLNRENEIMPQTKQKLLEMQSKGVILVLASGRGHRRLEQYAHQLQMEKYGGYLLEVNGLALYDVKKKERTVKSQLTLCDCRELFTFSVPFEIELQFIHDDGIFVYIPQARYEEKKAYRIQHSIPLDHPWTRGAFDYLNDNRQGYPEQVDITSWEEITIPVNKVGVTDDACRLHDYLKAARSHFQDTYWMGRTTDTWMEIMPKGITKGTALLELAQRLHITRDEIMAFGDGENDIEMLQAAAYGIAMGNALHNVKECAYAVTDDNNHDGIKKAIEKYCQA